MSDTSKKAPDAPTAKPEETKVPASTEEPKAPAPDTTAATAPSEANEAAASTTESSAPPVTETEEPKAPAPTVEDHAPAPSDIEPEIVDVLSAHFNTIKELDDFRLAPDLIKQLKQQHNQLEKLFERLVPSLSEA